MVLEAFPLDATLKDPTVYEQQEAAFHRFLTGLSSPIQICTRTVVYSLDDYLHYLDAHLEREANSPEANTVLLELGTAFREFIYLNNRGNPPYFRIHYYVVVWSLAMPPINISSGLSFISSLPFVGKLLPQGGRGTHVSAVDTSIAEDLRSRATAVASSLKAAEIRCRVLETNDLIQLYNSELNPAELGGKPSVSQDHLGRLTLDGS